MESHESALMAWARADDGILLEVGGNQRSKRQCDITSSLEAPSALLEVSVHDVRGVNLAT